MASARDVLIATVASRGFDHSRGEDNEPTVFQVVLTAATTMRSSTHACSSRPRRKSKMVEGVASPSAWEVEISILSFRGRVESKDDHILHRLFKTIHQARLEC